MNSVNHSSIQATYDIELVFNFGDPCPETDIIKGYLEPMTFELGSKEPVIQKFFYFKDKMGIKYNEPSLCN